MLSISSKEEELISDLRENLSDLLEFQEEYRQTDSFLTTWLRFKDHNVNKAEAALRKTNKWREEQHVDQVPKELIFDPQTLPYEHYGLDNDGRPVIWVPFGRFWDIHKIAQNNMQKEFLRYCIQFCENIEIRIKNEYYKRLEEDGGLVWQFTVVIDGGGFSYRQFLNPKAIKMVKDLVTMAESNWPLRCGGVIVINAPAIVKLLYNMIKPLLSEMTRSVFQIYNHNHEEWEQVLKDRIPVEVIPVCYGGQRQSAIDKFYLN